MRALREGADIDRLKAIFALGYSPFPRALEHIAPSLESADRLERCATACVMGVQRDERALPVLHDYYQYDDLDASGNLLPDAGLWYQDYYAILALVLAYWEPEEVVELLRNALLQFSAPDYPMTVQYYQNEYTPWNLLYALGRRGYFSIIEEVQFSDCGRCRALFGLAGGYLNLYQRYEQVDYALRGNEEVRKELIQTWKEFLDLSDQEIEQCFAIFRELGPTLFHLTWWRKSDDPI